MECGDTFLMPAPGGIATPHLWIVVTEPDPASNLCGIVSVTTLRNSKDQTVILHVGDHPFIRHESTIFYGDAMIVDAQRLEARLSPAWRFAGRSALRRRSSSFSRAWVHRRSPGRNSCGSAVSSGAGSGGQLNLESRSHQQFRLPENLSEVPAGNLWAIAHKFTQARH